MADTTKSRLLVLSTEKTTVVIDIGRAYTKIGVSGEGAPKCIIRSTSVLKPSGHKVNVWDQLEDEEQLYPVLCRFVQSLYLTHLLLNPKDHKVVIVESYICPETFRNMLARVLFQHLGVSFAAFVPSHLVCLFTIGRQSALVVDMGVKEATVLPVYEGIPIMAAWQSTTSAADTLHRSLKQLLLQRGKVRSISNGEEKLLSSITVEGIDGIIENILVRICFVRPFGSERTPPSVQYPLNKDYTLLVDGFIRDHVTEVLFNGEGDEPLQTCILESLLKCPIDTRRELASNIVMVGGIASMPGIKHRLKAEIDHILNTDIQGEAEAKKQARILAEKQARRQAGTEQVEKARPNLTGSAEVKQPLYWNHFHALHSLEYKFHNLPVHENCAAWLGGSIFGSLETTMLERGVSKESFKELGMLPDWTSCDPLHREQKKDVPIYKGLPH